MFRTVTRKLRSNPLDGIIKKAQRNKQTKFLLGWNRGMGDVALGLYAIVSRIRHFIPHASITFLVREDLYEAFKLLEDIEILCAPSWKRYEPYDMEKTLRAIGKSSRSFDVIINWPDPTYWVRWQLGKLCPKLKWDSKHDTFHHIFPIPEKKMIVAAQPFAETPKGLYRNWPSEKWNELFSRLAMFPDVAVVLFGTASSFVFDQHCIVDLRKKTSLLQMLSIIKNRATHLIVPDSGILSLAYYLDAEFPLHVLSLWADPHQGVLKQNVSSPNKKLLHTPLIAENQDLNNLSVDEVLMHLFPQRKSHDVF